MRAFRGLADITAHGYCMGCGLCTTVAPGAIAMELEPEGQIRPRAKRRLTEAEEARIVSLCPGVSVNGPFEAPMQNPDPVWGDALRVVEGWATDRETRFRASAGGVMTAVNRYLLESGKAAFILQVAAGGPDALTSRPVLIRDPDDLLTGSQSRYGACAPLTLIEEALDLGEPFAVSLKPCDVAGVRNLQRQDPRARDLIVHTIAMFCGTVPDRSSSWDFLRRRQIDPCENPPTAFRWRGNGCPGPTVATMADGRAVEGSYNEMWTDNPYSTQFRCKICPDAVGLQSDIATGDIWDNAVPTGETPGENAIIAHTAVGLEVLNACEAEGRLTLHDAETDRLSQVQPHHLRLRQTWPARVAAAAVAGLPVPQFEALAAEDCTAQVSHEDLAETFRGTLARIQAGQGSEAPSDRGVGDA
ncbi:MAG: Coenzyme F420 hydrogenase/dehydrogenase, beta subunit C-terminal domain [Pseudomonadota bacterium]